MDDNDNTQLILDRNAHIFKALDDLLKQIPPRDAEIMLMFLGSHIRDRLNELEKENLAMGLLKLATPVSRA